LSLILDTIQSHLATVELVKALEPTIALIADRIGVIFRKGGKLLVMGNGGSAADAQHIAAEFVVRFYVNRKALPALALTTDPSIVTAIGNDLGFDKLFVRQIEAFSRPGDIVIGISTSGTSRNIVEAITVAKERGCETVGLLGNDGGTLASMVDHSLIVPSHDTPRIQECHILIGHIICDIVEKGFATNAH
jgi:D-sedoheptulose 7-phosphate isomerase